jgi:peptidoglycan LD-endopeptidase CwlK
LKLKRRSLLITLFLAIIAILFFMVLNPHSRLDHSESYPTDLHPIVKDRSNQLVQQAANIGIVVMITDGFRSSEDQDRLYEKGRTTEGSIVTYAKGGESFHNFGLAIDFALKDTANGVIWDMQYDGNQNGKSDWNEVVELAKALGFKWGGDWAKFKDYPHLQMDFGLTLSDLQKGKMPAASSLTVDDNQDEQ